MQVKQKANRAGTIWRTAIWCIAGNFANFTVLQPSVNFCARNEKACGWRPKNVICDWESMWAAICNSLYSRNALLEPIQRVFALKNSQVLDRWSHCACNHAHPTWPQTTWNANSSENPPSPVYQRMELDVIAPLFIRQYAELCEQIFTEGRLSVQILRKASQKAETWKASVLMSISCMWSVVNNSQKD